MKRVIVERKIGVKAKSLQPFKIVENTADKQNNNWAIKIISIYIVPKNTILIVIHNSNIIVRTQVTIFSPLLDENKGMLKKTNP